jgi:hypothetical protein
MFREREGESKPQIEEEMWTALVGSIAHARTMNHQQTRAILSKTHSSLYFDHAHERLMFPSSAQSAILKRKRPVTPLEGLPLKTNPESARVTLIAKGTIGRTPWKNTSNRSYLSKI